MSTVNAWVNWLAWAGVVGWIYWLTDRALRLLSYAEQLLTAAERLLAAVPGNSAPPPPPRTEPMAAVIDVGLDRIFADEPPRRRHAASTNRKDHRS